MLFRSVVRTLGFLVGTSTDPFAPDVFIWWTEKFERVGVDLQDGEGVVWMLDDEEMGSSGGRAELKKAAAAGGKGREKSEAGVQTEGLRMVGAAVIRAA